jgi:hypothetical protein
LHFLYFLINLLLVEDVRLDSTDQAGFRVEMISIYGHVFCVPELERFHAFLIWDLVHLASGCDLLVRLGERSQSNDAVENVS